MAKDKIKVHGSFRLQISENGKTVSDTDFIDNQVVNLGFNDYLVKTLGAISGSKQISHVALGTGGAPAAADTSLSGEVQKRAAVTAATSSSSKTLRFTATFASSNSFVTASANISNIGLFNTSSSGTLFSGNTFASSSVATNQDVNVTYDLTFS